MAGWMIPAAIGIGSAIFGGGKKSRAPAPAPAPTPPPRPAAPKAPAKPRDIAMPSLLRNPGQYADPMQGLLGRQVQSNVAQDKGLSDQYRGALRNDAQAQMDLQRKRLQASAAERMNAMGLLGSGALGVQSGMIDEEYMRGMLGVESTLAQQDVQEKARLQNLLHGLQQDSSARTRYLAELGLRHSGMQNSSDMDYARLLSGHQLGVRGQDMDYNRMGYQGQLAQYNATNQANMTNAQMEQNRNASIFGNLMQGYNAYMGNQNAMQNRQFFQGLLDQRFGGKDDYLGSFFAR